MALKYSVFATMRTTNTQYKNSCANAQFRMKIHNWVQWYMLYAYFTINPCQMLKKKWDLYAIVLFFLFLGVIRMASQMDRETKDQYLVIIQAKDMVGQPGAFSATATVTINLSDINDNPPEFQQRE